MNHRPKLQSHVRSVQAMYWLALLFATSAAVIGTGCSSGSSSYDVDLTGVRSFRFENAIASADLTGDLTAVLEEKGYKFDADDQNGLLVTFDSNNENWNSERKVMISLAGRPVLIADARNPGFGNLLFAGAAHSNLEASVVSEVKKKLPDAN